MPTSKPCPACGYPNGWHEADCAVALKMMEAARVVERVTATNDNPGPTDAAALIQGAIACALSLVVVAAVALLVWGDDGDAAWLLQTVGTFCIGIVGGYCTRTLWDHVRSRRGRR